MSDRAPDCTHRDSIEITELPPSSDGCGECLRDGGTWTSPMLSR